jgi:hypothetical protein
MQARRRAARTALAGLLALAAAGCTSAPRALHTDADYGSVAAAGRPAAKPTADAAAGERKLAELKAATKAAEAKKRAAQAKRPPVPSLAQVKVVAGRINLTGGDLPPRYVSTSPDTTPRHHQKVSDFAECLGAVPLGQHVGSYASNNFGTLTGAVSGVAFGSEVTVLPSARDVAKDLAAIRGKDTVFCVQRLVGDLVFEGDGEAVFLSPKGRRKVPAPAAGSDGSYGYEYRFSMHGPKGQTVFTVTLMGFAKKRTHVKMTAIALGEGLPVAIRNDLFAVLVERGRQHAL